MNSKLYENLSVVMIAKNEEKAINDVVTEIFEVLPGAEVIVVDGSTDKTAQIATQAGAKVFREPETGGYGPALNLAIFLSKRDFVATVDADHTYDPRDIKKMFDKIKDGLDIVGGSRLSNGRPQSMPLLNYVANKAVNILSTLFFFRRIHDIHSGLRLYRMEKIRNLNWKSPDYGFTVEMLLIPIARRLRVVEVPISYRERIGSSHLMKLKSLAATLKSIFRARFRANKY